MAKFRRKSPPVTAAKASDGVSWDVIGAAGTTTRLSDTMFRATYRPIDADAYAALGMVKRELASGAFGRNAE